jgi:hypothetical protein
MTNGRHQPVAASGDRDGGTRILRVTGNRSRRVLLAAAAVGLCAIATGVALAAFASPGGQPAGHVAGASASGSPVSTAQTAPSTPPVASTTTGPNVTSAGIAKTALRYPPALKGQVQHWAAGRGGVAWSAVTAQLGGVTQTAGARLYSQLRQECATLSSNVRAAQSAPAIPDEAMQRMYAKVLAALSVTAADCRNAISVRQVGDEGQNINVNKALLKRSLAQFVTESRQLYAATAQIRTLRR